MLSLSLDHSLVSGRPSFRTITAVTDIPMLATGGTEVGTEVTVLVQIVAVETVVVMIVGLDKLIKRWRSMWRDGPRYI